MISESIEWNRPEFPGPTLNEGNGFFTAQDYPQEGIFYCHELRMVIELDGGVHDEMPMRKASHTGE